MSGLQFEEDKDFYNRNQIKNSSDQGSSLSHFLLRKKVFSSITELNIVYIVFALILFGFSFYLFFKASNKKPQILYREDLSPQELNNYPRSFIEALPNRPK